MNTKNKKQQKGHNQSSSSNASGPATQTTNPISVFVTRPKQQQQQQQSQQQQRPQQHTSAGRTSSNNNRTSANIATTYQQLEEAHAWAQGMTALINFVAQLDEKAANSDGAYMRRIYLKQELMGGMKALQFYKTLSYQTVFNHFTEKYAHIVVCTSLTLVPLTHFHTNYLTSASAFLLF